MTSCLFAQGTGSPTPVDSSAQRLQAGLPDSPAPHPTDEDLSAGAPAPQIELASAVDPQSGQAQNAQQPATGTAANSGAAAQSSSSSQNSAQQPKAQENEHQKAEEQIKEQEHQRMVVIVPAFNVTYHSDAVSLTPAEKFKLQFRAATDPYIFGVAMLVAGIGEANGSNRGFGWGPGGYAKRAAAAYGDNVIGHTFGNAILPSILHQDSRYFRLGHGSVGRRILNPLEGAVISKHDNTGKREPNYSNVLGNLIGGEISNLYYPSENRSNAGHTIATGLTVTLEGAFGSEVEEFWPDISRKLFHKDPTHGLDAQARAADAAAKQEMQQGEYKKNRQ
jgi:hypothetical protein